MPLNQQQLKSMAYKINEDLCSLKALLTPSTLISASNAELAQTFVRARLSAWSSQIFCLTTKKRGSEIFRAFFGYQLVSSFLQEELRCHKNNSPGEGDTKYATASLVELEVQQIVA